MVRTLAAASLVVLAACGDAVAAGPFDPALRFRELHAEHFVIYFHQGEDRAARRLASIADETWRIYRDVLGAQPPAMTRVVLVDQTELANGSATPLPYDVITVTSAWPPGVEFIGDADDWLRLVFTHEFTHIVHLDRSEGWARAVRAVFGRTEIAFPNLFLPTWQIEGLATFEESRLTGAGRLHAGDFRAVLTEAARAGRLEPLGRVNGGLTDWPSGNAPYAYGAGFHEYLATRFKGDTLEELARATAGRLPYTASRAFKHVFGESLGALWRDYEASLAIEAKTDPRRAAGTRLTHHGFVVSGPRFDPFAPNRISYSVRTAHRFPALNEVTLDGGRPRQLTRRYLGATTAIARDAVYFDQQELHRATGLYSDLYAMPRAGGRVRRITSEARLLDPDLSPDGERLAAVQESRGQRNLVVVTLHGGSKGRSPGGSKKPAAHDAPTVDTLVAEPETQFNAPRWSPDGKSIAVERHRPGALSDVVVVDAATRAVRPLVSMPGARIVTPAWRPDGRAIVAAVAAQDAPFNLFEFSPNGGNTAPMPITATSGGATWPDVSPDGRLIVYVGYTADGFDLFTVPYPPSELREGVVQSSTTGAPTASAGTPLVVRQAQDERILAPIPGALGPSKDERPYSPLATLRPTSWSPILESDSTQTRIGAATFGVDVLGHHAYAVSASWLVSQPEGSLVPPRGSPDWNVYYAYTRWQPTFWTAASLQTDFFAGAASESDTPARVTLRERQVEAGVFLPMPHVRVSHTAVASIVRGVDDYTLADGVISRGLGALRGGWATSSAHTYGYSISPEGGMTAGATGESATRALGSFAEAAVVTADARAYLPGLRQHHVAALRFAAGRSTGDRDVRRTFHLGGPGPDGSVISFDRRAISVLRGFAADSFAGSRVALINADYRFPIARPQRGIGTWPLFLHTVHGAVFADAGHAWTRRFSIDAIKTSFGAELSANLVAGFFFPIDVAAGVARGRDRSGTVADATTLYFRIGRTF